MNKIKVSVDAATFAEENACDIGLVARNSDGEVVHAQTWRYWGRTTPEFAEGLAIKEALSWCMLQEGQSIEVESDFLVIIQAIRLCAYGVPSRSYY